MAITVQVPTGLIQKLATKEVDWVDDDIRGLLYTDFVFDQDADKYLGDVGTKTEHAGTGGYSTGGIALTGMALSQVDVGNKTRITSDPFEIDPAAIASVTHFVIIDFETASAATSPIVVVYDLGGPQSTSTLWRNTPHADGWLFGATT